MKAFGRLGTAVAAAWLAFVPGSLAAQVAVDPSAPAENAVGPAQLRDFSLDGTVIRRSEPAPDRSAPAPARQQQTTQTAAQPRPAPAPADTEAPRQVAQRETQPQQQPQRQAAAQPAAASPATGSIPFDLGEPSPANPFSSPAPALPASSETLADSGFAPSDLDDQGSGFSPLPWLFAILLFGGGAFFYFRRQRSPLAFAGPAGVSEFVAPEPAPRPAPPRAAPQPAPTPAPPAAPIGIISTRLRPWLDVQFAPGQVTFDGERAMVEFDVAVANSGSGPAREVLVEAAMFNAGEHQDKEIGAFFDRPVGQGDRVPMIAPLKSLGFRSAVSMTREQLRLFKAGDRSVFVPLVAINVLYRWSGGEAQTSASFLVGKQTSGDKLAPFGADQSPRTFSGLGARQLDLKVRK